MQAMGHAAGLFGEVRQSSGAEQRKMPRRGTTESYTALMIKSHTEACDVQLGDAQLISLSCL